MPRPCAGGTVPDGGLSGVNLNVFAPAFQMKFDRFPNLVRHVLDGGARGDAAGKIRDVSRVDDLAGSFGCLQALLKRDPDEFAER